LISAAFFPPAHRNGTGLLTVQRRGPDFVDDFPVGTSNPRETKGGELDAGTAGDAGFLVWIDDPVSLCEACCVTDVFFRASKEGIKIPRAHHGIEGRAPPSCRRPRPMAIFPRPSVARGSTHRLPRAALPREPARRRRCDHRESAPSQAGWWCCCGIAAGANRLRSPSLSDPINPACYDLSACSVSQPPARPRLFGSAPVQATAAGRSAAPE